MTRLFVPAMAVFLLLPGVVAAQEKGPEQCAQAFDQCVADCRSDNPDDVAGRAACMPTCSGKYAACDAGVAYDKAKPWVEEQAKKTKKFFEDLMDDLKKDEAPADPQSKDKSI